MSKISFETKRLRSNSDKQMLWYLLEEEEEGGEGDHVEVEVVEEEEEFWKSGKKYWAGGR